MTYKKGNCAEFGPVDVFQFKSDSVKPISCVRIKVLIIINNNMVAGSVDRWFGVRWLLSRWKTCRWSVVGCRLSVGRCRTCQWVGGQLSVAGGSVEDLLVDRWLVVGGRWPVGGRWFCNTPIKDGQRLS